MEIKSKKATKIIVLAILSFFIIVFSFSTIQAYSALSFFDAKQIASVVVDFKESQTGYHSNFGLTNTEIQKFVDSVKSTRAMHLNTGNERLIAEMSIQVTKKDGSMRELSIYVRLDTSNNSDAQLVLKDSIGWSIPIRESEEFSWFCEEMLVTHRIH
jgi:hypothetical protein